MQKLFRPFLGVVAVIAGAVGVVAAVPSAAAAQNPPAKLSVRAKSDCPTGRLCLWQNSYYSGTLGMYPQYPVGQCHQMGALNNQVTSVWNRTGRGVGLFNDANCANPLRIGSAIYFAPGNSDPNLEYFLNDKVSSFKWY